MFGDDVAIQSVEDGQLIFRQLDDIILAIFKDDVAVDHHIVRFALLHGLVDAVPRTDVGPAKVAFHDVHPF